MLACAGLFQELNAHSVFHLLHEIHQPTLLISGEFDPITPPIYGEQVAGTLTNATHVVITGVSHDPISTSPDCAVQMVDAFLDDPLAAVDDACADDLVTDFSPGF